jgi:hypothetical protein
VTRTGRQYAPSRPSPRTRWGWWSGALEIPSLHQVPTLAVDVTGQGPARGIVWYRGDMDPDGLASTAGATQLCLQPSVHC